MKVRFCFSAEQIKNIALVSMVIDHAAVGLIEQSELASGVAWSLCGTAMRLVGRVAFPLFAFMIAEMVCAEAASAGSYFGDPL